LGLAGAGTLDRYREASKPGKPQRAAIVRAKRASGSSGESDGLTDDVFGGISEASFVGEYEAYIDAWMLRQFPGRLLEELDDMDWLRFRRAQDAQRVIDVEDTRQLYRDGKLKEVDEEMLAAFVEHDDLVSDGL